MAYCEWVTYPDGTRALARFVGQRRPEACATCGQPGRYLCDAPLGPVTFGETPRTCDAPMCDTHRTSVAAGVDHCPEHVASKAPA